MAAKKKDATAPDAPVVFKTVIADRPGFYGNKYRNEGDEVPVNAAEPIPSWTHEVE